MAFNKTRTKSTIHINWKKMVAFTVLSSLCFYVSAGDLKLKAGVSAKYVNQDIYEEDEDSTIASNNLIIKPFASIGYKTRSLYLFFQGTNNQVRRELSNQTVIKNYTEYKYSSDLDIIDDIFSMKLSGTQQYRNSSINSYQVDDFLLNADSLNKVTTNRAKMNLNLRRGDYYGLTSSVSYSNTESERGNVSEIDDESVFSNDSYSLGFNAISGENLQGARLILSGNMRYSERSSGRDYESQNLNLSSDIDIYNDFGLALDATYENNEIKVEVDTPSNGLREFYSYGAGVSWRPSNGRSAEVLLNKSFNKSEAQGAEDEENIYLSYSINWAFSNRTSLQAGLSRRFYGNSANLSFLHQTRMWRSSVTYNETISSQSQLVSVFDIGLFVCDNGSTDISSCRLSNSLQPELEPNEQLQPLVIQNYDLNDRVVLRKSLTLQSAVTRRKTNLSLTATKSSNEEIEINRIYDISTFTVGASVNLSRNSTLGLSHRFSKTERDQNGNAEKSITQVQKIEYNRQLSSKLKGAVSLSYLSRNGEVNSGFNQLSGINGSLTDRRITLSLSYSFGSK